MASCWLSGGPWWLREGHRRRETWVYDEGLWIELASSVRGCRILCRILS